MPRDARLFRLPAVFCILLAAPLSADAADGWGSVEDQFVLDGDVPEAQLLVRKGDQKARDPEVCAAQDIRGEELVVDPDSKGIANIFVYLRRAPKSIHPDLRASREKEVVSDQKACQFIPHALFVRTDQVVLVKSDDPVPHNTHTTPVQNTDINLVIAANDRKGVPYKHAKAELIPIPVKCDIHPHMTANWLILDHPYAAITDGQGRFRIENLPAGEHTFQIWHEMTGFVDKKVGGQRLVQPIVVRVEDGKVATPDPVEVPAKLFEKKK